MFSFDQMKGQVESTSDIMMSDKVPNYIGTVVIVKAVEWVTRKKSVAIPCMKYVSESKTSITDESFGQKAFRIDKAISDRSFPEYGTQYSCLKMECEIFRFRKMVSK
jgi:hypothetical protein